MGPGYQALREAAGYIDLSARGKIFAAGEDRVRLLHAMTTNHIQQLQPGQGCYAFFLTAQGRILADANVLILPDRILLDVEPELRQTLYQHLDKFIIADDVRLEDVSDSLRAISVEGPKAEEVLALAEILMLFSSHAEKISKMALIVSIHRGDWSEVASKLRKLRKRTEREVRRYSEEAERAYYTRRVNRSNAGVVG